MIVLALDQSSKTSGFSVFDTSNQALIACGTFTFEDAAIEKRLYEIRQKVLSLIDQYKVNQLVIEDIQLQTTNNVQNVLTYKVLAEVFGVIAETAYERHLPCEVIHSTTWKSACKVGGRTRAEQKQNAQKHVKEKYDLTVSQDAADAICIGECYCATRVCAW